VGVLGHSAALVCVQEDIVNVERGSNKGLIVGNGGRDRASNGHLLSSIPPGTVRAKRSLIAVEGGDSPQALVNRADIKVDLDLVVLESN